MKVGAADVGIRIFRDRTSDSAVQCARSEWER